MDGDQSNTLYKSQGDFVSTKFRKEIDELLKKKEKKRNRWFHKQGRRVMISLCSCGISREDTLLGRLHAGLFLRVIPD